MLYTPKSRLWDRPSSLDWTSDTTSGITISTSKLNGLTSTSLTVLFWLYQPAGKGNWLWEITDQLGNYITILSNNTAGQYLVFTSGNNITVGNWNIKEWTAIGLTLSGTTGIGYFRNIKSKWTSGTNTMPSFTANTVCMGNLFQLSAGGVGYTAGLKMWSFPMTATQLFAESQQLAPLCTRGLVSYCPERNTGSSAVDEYRLSNSQGSSGWVKSGTIKNAFRGPPIPEVLVRRRMVYLGSGGGSTKAMQVSIVGQTTEVYTMSVARAMTDAIVGNATVVDALSVARPLSNAIVGRATVADPLNVARPLTQAISGSASLAMTSKVARGVTNNVHGTSSMSDTMGVTRGMALGVSGSSTVSAATKVARAMVAAINGVATFASQFGATRPLAVALSGLARMVATLAGKPGTTGFQIDSRGRRRPDVFRRGR